MKKQSIFARIVSFILSCIIIIPLFIGGVTYLQIRLQEQETAKIEAQTAKMRVQIEADNAQHNRAKDWYYTISNTVLIALLFVVIVRKFRRQDEKFADMIDWMVKRGR